MSKVNKKNLIIFILFLVFLLFSSLSYSKAQILKVNILEMNVPRYNHQCFKLSDGRVVILGGDHEGLFNIFKKTTIEIFNPESNKFVVVKKAFIPLGQDKGILLPNDKIYFNNGAIYDIQKNTINYNFFKVIKWFFNSFTPIFNGVYNYSFLSDRHVLSGQKYMRGHNPFDVDTCGQIWVKDMLTGEKSKKGSLKVPRANFKAVELKNGKVLIIGGVDLNTKINNTAYKYIKEIELFDPKTGKVKIIGKSKEDYIFPVLMKDGNVLLMPENHQNYEHKKIEILNTKENKIIDTKKVNKIVGSLGKGLIFDDNNIIFSDNLNLIHIYNSKTFDAKTIKKNPPYFICEESQVTILNDKRILITGGISYFCNDPGRKYREATIFTLKNIKY